MPLSRKSGMALLLAVGAVALWGPMAALTALPALVLAGLLLADRYVGERAYVRRLLRRLRAPRRRIPRISASSRVAVLPCGSALLGLARGLRGPPRAA